MQECLISFGSNLGDSKQIILESLDELRNQLRQKQQFDSPFRVSDFLVTRPIGGPEDQQEFINGAVRFQTTLDSRSILDLLHQIERLHGRERRIRWDARTLDLDLLIHGDTVLLQGNFRVPHPRMCFRQFVLQPAVQVAGDLIHPICGVSLETLLNCVQQRREDLLLFTSDAQAKKINSGIAGLEAGSAIDVVSWDRLPDFVAQAPCHKLVAFDLVDIQKNFFLQQRKDVIQWQKGPVTFFEDDSSEQIVTDLCAAVDAMKAL